MPTATTPADRGSPRADFAIDLTHVAKTYRGNVQALRGISMRVNRGEIFGLLGPNGAGKSTLVKILMTVISPSRCEGTMLSQRVGTKAALRRVGYLPEHHRFPDYLTGRQVLDHFGAMSDVPRRVRRQRTNELLPLVGLEAWQDKRVKGYSKGMRQRLGVAQSLINDPDLVLLDEPTDGVDPVGRRDIRAVLQELKRRGKTVFLNSHLLSELEMVSDRVAIMVRGVVTAQGTIDELTAYGRRYEIELAAGSDKPLDAATRIRQMLQAPGVVRGLELTGSLDDLATPDTAAGARSAGPVMRGRLASGESVEVEGPLIRLGTDDAERVQPVIDALRSSGATVRAVRPVRPSLEDLFMRAVTDPTTGAVLSPGAEMDRANGKGGRR
ncbi:MAG: ATP-binding cassette domain-containing protein [Phycisphaeraceae bacterium]|nr:ATP-binding cassette domain-containing protein [Phycisphaeraceae bacterium]